MIISVHLRRCGGTSFRDCIKQYFRKKCFFDYGDETGSTWPSSVAKRKKSYKILLSKKKIIENDYEIIHGHFYRSKYDLFKKNCKYISFVRNPVSRVISNYFHIKKNNFRNHPDSYIVNKLDFSLEEFAKHPDNINHQYKYLQTKNLKEFLFIGNIENYDQSLQKLNSILGINMKKINKKNSNSFKEHDYSFVSNKTKNLIKNLNYLDIKLYEKVLKIFN